MGKIGGVCGSADQTHRVPSVREDTPIRGFSLLALPSVESALFVILYFFNRLIDNKQQRESRGGSVNDGSGSLPRGDMDKDPALLRHTGHHCVRQYLQAPEENLRHGLSLVRV